jgi:hypothetical protein
MNPNGLVPTIKDGDFVLWESNSIMRYLNAKYGNGKLLPASPEGMASANRWMDWQLSAFNPVIVPLFFATIRTPPDKRDPQAIQAALEKTVRLGKWSRITSPEPFSRRRGIFPGGYTTGCLGLPVVQFTHRPPQTAESRTLV